MPGRTVCHHLQSQGTTYDIAKCLLALVKQSEFGSSALKSSGAIGALIPGADGDFAQFIFYAQADRDAFLQALEEACKGKNLAFEKISGQQFEEKNWYVTAAPSAS